MADDQKRRELIFQMAMDMNRKNAREPHVTGQASMSQGEPPEQGLEDTMQLDEILALPAAMVTPMLVKKIAQYEAKRLGPAAAKLQKTTGQAGARMGMLQRAEEMEKRNAEHSGSSLWMNPQYASELGVPHNPVWDLGPSALKPELEKRLDSGWLEAARKQKQGYLDDVKSGKKGNTDISKPWDYKTSGAMAPAEEVSADEIEDMLEQMAKPKSDVVKLPDTGGRGLKNPKKKK